MWVQWDYICLWADFLGKDTHNGGTLLLNNSKGRPLAAADKQGYTHIFLFTFLIRYLLFYFLSPSLSSSPFSSLLRELTSFTSLSGKQRCSFSSQKPLCSLFFCSSFDLICPRLCIYNILSFTHLFIPCRGTSTIPKEWESYPASLRTFLNIYSPWTRTLNSI